MISDDEDAKVKEEPDMTVAFRHIGAHQPGQTTEKNTQRSKSPVVLNTPERGQNPNNSHSPWIRERSQSLGIK